GDAVTRQERLDDIAARAEQCLGGDDMVAGLELAEEGGGHRRHAGRRGARRAGALEEAHALLEHGNGRVGETRIDETGLIAGKARRGTLGAVIDEALSEEERLGGLAEFRSQGAAMYELGRRSEALLVGFLLGCTGLSRHDSPPKQK